VGNNIVAVLLVLVLILKEVIDRFGLLSVYKKNKKKFSQVPS
jgi:hypothetical protein